MNNCKSHPNKTLEKHIEEIFTIFYRLVDFYGIQLSKDIRDLFENLIKLHDIGKCRKEFQEYIKKLEGGGFVKSPGRHTLWSLEDLKNIDIKSINLRKEYLPLLYFLIAKHHSNLTLNFDDNVAKVIKELISKYYYNLSTLEDIKKLYNSSNLSRDDILRMANFYISPPREALRLFFSNYLGELNKDTLFEIADLFGLFKIADSLSAQNSLKNINKITKIEKIEESKIRSLIGKEIDEKRWTIQSNIANYDYLILRAPTGWGKTTVSLLFAKNKDYRRIFITLPTITSIEKFYEKLRKNFNAEMYFYLYDAYLSLEDEIDEKIRALYYIRNLYSPINITTADQILLSFLQTGKYFLKRLNLRKSVLIFDEIHLLTPQMIFLLKKMLKYLLPKYNIKILLMSATLPKGLVEYLSEDLTFETIDIYGLWNKNYFDEKYYNRERVEFELIEKDILEDLDKIVEENKKGKSVLVIVNTVEKAVAIYKKLKDEYRIKNILLLHSRFMFRDRKEKEETIECIEKLKGIFVSTQVSEVSLDIDFDILFTELAPISSLVQRAGRVNRYGTKEKTKVYVYYSKELHKIAEDKRFKYPYEIEEVLKSVEILKELRSYKEGEIIKIIDEILNRDFYDSLIRKKIAKYNIAEIFRDFFERDDTRLSLFWFLSLTSNEDAAKKLLEFRENLTTLIIPGISLVEKELSNDISKLINKYEKLKESNAKYEDWVRFFAKAKSYTVPVPIWILLNIREDNIKKYAFPVIEKLREDYNFRYFREIGFVNVDKLLEYGVDIQINDDFY